MSMARSSFAQGGSEPGRLGISKNVQASAGTGTPGINRIGNRASGQQVSMRVDTHASGQQVSMRVDSKDC